MSEIKNRKDTVLDDLLQDPFGDITLETKADTEVTPSMSNETVEGPNVTDEITQQSKAKRVIDTLPDEENGTTASKSN